MKSIKNYLIGSIDAMDKLDGKEVFLEYYEGRPSNWNLPKVKIVDVQDVNSKYIIDKYGKKYPVGRINRIFKWAYGYSTPHIISDFLKQRNDGTDGKPVMIVLKDGGHSIGDIESVTDGKLRLKEEGPGTFEVHVSDIIGIYTGIEFLYIKSYK